MQNIFLSDVNGIGCLKVVISSSNLRTYAVMKFNKITSELLMYNLYYGSTAPVLCAVIMGCQLT